MWEKWMANSLQGTKLFFSSWCNWKGFSPWVWGCQLYVLADMFYWWRKPKYFEVCTCFENWYPGLSGGTLSPGVLKWDRESQIHLKSLAMNSCDIWFCCIDYLWKLEISPRKWEIFLKNFHPNWKHWKHLFLLRSFCGSMVFFQLNINRVLAEYGWNTGRNVEWISNKNMFLFCRVMMVMMMMMMMMMMMKLK